jgi:hypothetical protein
VVVEAVERAAVVMRVATRVGTALAIGLAVHTLVNLRALRRPDPKAPAVQEPIRVLIPARNEADHVARTVTSALDQMGLNDFSVHVLDDGSSDGTAAAVAGITDDRLTVASAPDAPPPAGWLGKPWACQRLSAGAHGSVLVFLDADVHIEPWAIRGCIEILRSGDFALVAPYPQQVAETWLERLVQPLVTWSWIATLPLPWAERSQRPSLSAANGQFLVLDADAYRSIGGHAAVAGDVIEDVALMRALKRAGYRTVTIDGSEAATCRMYDGTEQVVAGYTKSLWAAFNGPLGAIGATTLLILSGVAPSVAMILSPRNRAIGTIGYLAIVTSRVAAARRTGDRIIPDAFAHPMSIAAFTALNALSWWRHLRGTNQWKGRPVR